MESSQRVVGDCGQYTFKIDNSFYVSSDINDTSEHQFRTGSPYGPSFSDTHFVEQLEKLEDAVKCNNLTKCKEIAETIRDINGIFHYRSNSFPSYTVLYKAVEKKNIKAVEILLNNGANPDIRNNLGETARTLAEKINEPAIVALIKQKTPAEEILSTTEQSVKFKREPGRGLRNCASFSATVWFGKQPGEYAKMSFVGVGEKYTEIYEMDMNVKIVKASRSGVISYRFITKSDSIVTVMPSSFDKYLLSKDGITENQAGKGEIPGDCIIS
ncbi:MAG: hypothetical protein H0T62_12575 [Parachlamydiaceae bacterium]|nr:hypothetical protein [Parachlamydiaceae bacterium]